MNLYLFLLIPFLLQVILITVDEWYFHIKRGLPKWERVGHPIDTLTLLICLLFALNVPYSTLALKWYIGLALLSCLMVTKDEFVHKHVAPAAENWLHALLFINHPLILAIVGLFWFITQSGQEASVNWISSLLPHARKLNLFLLIQTLFVAIFFIYQVIYWNVIWKEEKEDSAPHSR